MNFQSNDDQPPIIKHQVDHLTGGVIVPGLQAIITGTLCGLAALALTAWFGLPWLAIGGTTAAVTAAGAWLSYRNRYQWLLERILGADLNGDGYIGQPILQQLPPAQSETITIHLTKNEGQEGAFIPLPYPEKIPQLAQTILEGRSYSQATLVPRMLTRPEYDAIIDAMITGGLMRWKNPDHHNIGVEVTAAGRAVLKRLLPPPPEDNDE